ncbi:MAG: CBS domain-containing protein, partial [Deltaproteobacteria bacterium]|nr:CBS domain-containing protein [Deltaproteobacteria bacterium]
MTPKTVREIMTTEVVTLLRNDTLRLADDMMILTNLRHFPVLEEGKAVGIIHRLDLIRASLVSVIKY